jgi:hypothetical protein
MRCGMLLVLLIFAGAGCASKPGGISTSYPAGQGDVVGGKPAARDSAPPKAPPVIVTPGSSNSGRISSVNAGARFVVISFASGQLPALERQLGVFRNGLKVAEIKITGPHRDGNTVGDILAGECQAGDEVRLE